MNLTPQRDAWNHTPRELETVWALTKGNRPARLVIYTHPLGWEAKVESGDLLLTQVCRSDREIEAVAAGWRDAMLAKGWTEH